jgi:hypothetical protein
MNIFYSKINIEEMRPAGFHQSRNDAIDQLCQKVAQGGGWNDVKFCPGCSSTRRAKIMRKCGIDIFQCESCTLGYAASIPKNINDAYSDRKYLKQARQDYGQNINYRIERFAAERISILRRWSDRKPEDSHLLDIGCGIGWFLEAAGRQRFAVAGQELGLSLV